MRKGFRRLLLSLVAALTITGAAATTASADTYCVGSVPMCTGVAFSGDGAGLQLALDAAAASPSTPDRVLIGPGLYTSSSNYGFTYTDAASDSIEIAGQGMSTQLVNDNPSSQAGMQLTLNPASSVRDLKFGPITVPVSFYRDLVLYGGSASGLTFDAVGAALGWRYAVVLNGNNGEPVSLSRSTIVGNGNSASNGIGVNLAANATIDRVKVSGVATGLRARHTANFKLRNSLVDLGGIAGQGIYLDGNVGDADVVGFLDHVTVVGDAVGAHGVEVQGYDDYANPIAAKATLTMKNSIIDLPGDFSKDLLCPNDGMVYAQINVNLTRVAADATSFDNGACTPTNTAPIDTTTALLNFTNRTARDFTLAGGSAAIDAGDPAFVALPGELDLAGNCRVNGAATDLGAYEAGSCPSGTPANPPATPQTPAFTLKFGKLKGSIKSGRKAKALRRGKKSSRPSLPISLSSAAKVSFKLAPKAKKGKQLKFLRGTLKLKIPAGTSYLTWGAAWAKKKLRPGSYVLAASAPGMAKPVLLRVKIKR